MGQLRRLLSGREIYCTETGAGPALVCIHGLGGGSYFFAGLAAALQPGFRVLSVDLPGCGLSPAAPAGFSFDDCVVMIEDLVRGTTDKPVAVLGHSMGAIIGLKLAGRRTVPVDRLIFVGGLDEPVPDAQKRLRERAREVHDRGMAGVGDLTMPIVFSADTLRKMPGLVAMYHRLLELNDPNTYARAAEELSNASAADTLSGISVPCLAVTGSEDRYAPPAAVKAFVSRLRGPAEYREIEGCGHMPFFEKPEIFEEIVRGFLKR